jgi:hypothetical protein
MSAEVVNQSRNFLDKRRFLQVDVKGTTGQMGVGAAGSESFKRHLTLPVSGHLACYLLCLYREVLLCGGGACWYEGVGPAGMPLWWTIEP